MYLTNNIIGHIREMILEGIRHYFDCVALLVVYCKALIGLKKQTIVVITFFSQLMVKMT